MDVVGVSQAELVRLLTLAGEKTATTTVNRWCTGAGPLDEDALRYVLTILKLPADWTPTTTTTTTTTTPSA